MRATLTVGVGLAILQQITGINTVIYYAPTIVQDAGIGSSSAAILTAVAAGVVNVGMTIVAIRLLDRVGRRPLLLIGVAGMTVSLFTLGLAFELGEGSTATSIVAVGSLVVFVASFAVSLGPIFWLINSEIYPLRNRSKAAALATFGELDLQLRGRAHVPTSRRCPRPEWNLLALRRGRNLHLHLLPQARAGDQGPATRGHHGRVRAARARRRPGFGRADTRRSLSPGRRLQAAPRAGTPGPAE